MMIPVNTTSALVQQVTDWHSGTSVVLWGVIESGAEVSKGVMQHQTHVC